MNLPKRRWLACAVVGILGVLAAAAPAGTRRHDYGDTAYFNLGNQSTYAAVGMVTQDGMTASGVLIAKFGQAWVLTAGHVVDNSALPMFFEVGGNTYEAADWFSHPGWSGSLTTGNDIGLIRLATVPTGVALAVRYRGTDELGQKGVSVGYGRGGTGLSGDSLDAGTKRGGENMIDVLGGALGYSNNILMADFDNPNDPADSSWGSAVPVTLEMCPVPGDSGGGLFIQESGRHWLAGITSFIVHESTPWWQNPLMRLGFYGDTTGWTRVSAFNNWIDSNIPHYWTSFSPNAPFSNAANWEQGIVPGAGHAAVLDMSGSRTMTFSEDVTNRTLHLAHGNFTFSLGGFTYTASGSPSLLVGDEAVENAKLIVSGGTLVTGGDAFLGRQASAVGAVQTTTGGVWNAQGSVYVGGTAAGPGGKGSLTVGAGSTVNVNGTLRVRDLGIDGQVAVSGNASAGTFDLSVALERTLPDIRVFNGGVLTTGNTFLGKDPNTKALVQIDSGGTWNVTGSMYVGGTATVAGGANAHGTGTVKAGGTLNVAGTLKLWQITPNTFFKIDGQATVGNLDFSAGVLDGIGTLTLTGTGSIWTGGKMRAQAVGVGTGKTIVAPGAVLTLDGTERKNLTARVVENAGTVVWRGTGRIDAWFGSIFHILPGGLFDARNDASILGDGPAADPIINEGTFLKSAGAGTTTVDIPFDNRGTVEARSGTLLFAEPVTQLVGTTLTGGTWIARTGSTLQLQAGSNVTVNQGNVVLEGLGSVFAKVNSLADNQGGFTILGGHDFTTAGPFVNSGAVTVGAGSTFSAAGPYTQTAGSTTVSGFLATGGTVNIAGGTFTINRGAGGTVGLADNHLIVDYTGGPNPFAGIAACVASG
ncbi:MAG: hypothetical protein AMK72_08575, partial [Planctomycetes bacterium SM23_25]